VPDIFTLQNLCVVLVSTRNPLNIGAVARAMSNFGVHDLRVVHPYEAAFREARSAVGAEDLLAHAAQFETIADAIADCTLVVGTTAVKQRELRHPLFTLQDAAPKILEHLASAGDGEAKAAILFGPEKHGLSNGDMSHCHWLMHIPTGHEQPSMNLGQAAAVCLYELVRGPYHAEVMPALQPASSADLERITEVLLQALHSSGYMDSQPTDAHEESVRRMVRRLTVSAEDASVLLGMLRQVLWKLKSRE